MSSHRPRTEHRRAGFTLLELLVVIALCVVVLGLTLGAVQKVRAAAAQLQCANQLRQLALACHTFHDRHQRLSPAFGFLDKASLQGGAALGPLFFHLLPDIEQQALFQKSEYKQSGPRPQDFFFYIAIGVHQTSVPLYICPSDPTLSPGINPKTNYAPSSYAGNYLVFGVVNDKFVSVRPQGKATLVENFSDGLDHTLLFAEKYALASIPPSANGVFPGYSGGCHWAYFQANCNNPLVAYYQPGYNIDPNSIGPVAPTDPHDSHFQVQPAPTHANPCLAATAHTTMNAALANGSVRQLSGSIRPAVWWALLTPNAGDQAG